MARIGGISAGAVFSGYERPACERRARSQHNLVQPLSAATGLDVRGGRRGPAARARPTAGSLQFLQRGWIHVDRAADPQTGFASARVWTSTSQSVPLL